MEKKRINLRNNNDTESAPHKREWELKKEENIDFNLKHRFQPENIDLNLN